MDNAITYKAQRDKNAREPKPANAAITDMQMRQRDVLLRSMQNTKELADAKVENDALRDDAVAGRRRPDIVPVCRQCVKPPRSGVDNAASPDWQTIFERDYFTSERG